MQKQPAKDKSVKFLVLVTCVFHEDICPGHKREGTGSHLHTPRPLVGCRERRRCRARRRSRRSTTTWTRSPARSRRTPGAAAGVARCRALCRSTRPAPTRPSPTSLVRSVWTSGTVVLSFFRFWHPISVNLVFQSFHAAVFSRKAHVLIEMRNQSLREVLCRARARVCAHAHALSEIVLSAASWSALHWGLASVVCVFLHARTLAHAGILTCACLFVPRGSDEETVSGGGRGGDSELVSGGEGRDARTGSDTGSHGPRRRALR